MRTNFEDSAWSEGLVSGVMARMQVIEFTACGMLTCLWKDSQRAGFISGKRSALLAIIGSRYASDDEANRFVNACLTCGAIRQLDDGDVEVVGNAKHVRRYAQIISASSAGGKARAASGADAPRTADGRFTAGVRDPQASRDPAVRLVDGSREPAESHPPSSAPYSQLPTPIRTKKEADALAAQDASDLVEKREPHEIPKQKRRTPEKVERSKAVNRRYLELYEQAEGHEPTGVDAAFNTKLARFADKHAEKAMTILEWMFETPNPKYRNKAWALWLLDADADVLWRELNDKRKAIEGIAAPVQNRQLSLDAHNALVIEEALGLRPGELTGAPERAKLGS